MSQYFTVCMLFAVRIRGIDFGLVSFPLIGKCSISCAMLKSQKFRDLSMRMTGRWDNLLIHFLYTPVDTALFSKITFRSLYLIVLVAQFLV